MIERKRHVTLLGKEVKYVSKLFDSFLVHYLERFNDHCFSVKVGDNEYTIGEGTPEFTIRVTRYP